MILIKGIAELLGYALLGAIAIGFVCSVFEFIHWAIIGIKKILT